MNETTDKLTEIHVNYPSGLRMTLLVTPEQLEGITELTKRGMRLYQAVSEIAKRNQDLQGSSSKI